MKSYANIVELALERAARQPNNIAYTFLTDGESESSSLTYSELVTRTRALAANIAQHATASSRVLLVFEPGLDFVIAFLACQFAGVVAVPVYPPRKPQDWPRFAAIAIDCDSAAVCTQQAHAALLQMGLSGTPGLANVKVIASDTVDASAATLWKMPEIKADGLSFLQYTSGSTGVPKGVMVSHANLMHNEAIIQQGFNHSTDSVCVSWLPQYHDMGLIGGILQPLFLGFRCVLMSPLAFLQQPVRWLKAISHYGGTTSGAPNFAYELCLRRISDEDIAQLDLSTWKIAFNGAEPVRVATLERFATKFAACGFRREAFFPCYGLAESTLYVTGSKHAEFPQILHVDAADLARHTLTPSAPDAEGSRALVGAGTPIGQQVRIVDPSTCHECPPGGIGEIWVQGPSVASGYWNRPETTEETFAARIADTHEGPFMRTGDLGALLDGELYVTGRLKELIIVDGRNHYPQDIEETAQTGRPLLRRGCGAAFSVEVDGAERLVLVQEVVDGHPQADLEQISQDIRTAIAEQHGLAIYRLCLIKQGELQKTSSGKIRRRAMRDRYLGKQLNEIYVSTGTSSREPLTTTSTAASPPVRASRSVTLTEQLISRLVARQIGLDPSAIDTHLQFASYGLDSRALVGLSGELELELGRRLEPQLFYNYPSVAALARFLSEGQSVGASSSTESNATQDAIAIVGMACKLPGAPDLDAFWDLLQGGIDAITEVPADRWDINAWYNADPSTPGKMATRWGGFIDNVGHFDGDFFSISPREAVAMDPQQRLLLQLSWHALEDAGIAPSTLRGGRGGVFIGISGNDYARLQAGGSNLLSPHAGTGNALSIAANRLSYFLDLHGPSLALDTACSSSLTAVHTAATYLKSGACDIALAGGVNLLLSPDMTVSFSQNRMMSADGRCKAFSEQADGYVRAEGGGVVVLKRLKDAQAAGDRIWAVIPGSACNQDGRSNGLTAPNGLAQQAVVRDALSQAGWTPADVAFVETHGTGTKLGDPIEAEALAMVYGQSRPPASPLILGALKSQIGHLEAAAGMAGLIKTALCLTHQRIPANLHCETPNQLIPLDRWNLALPQAAQPWPTNTALRAGVSAFGFGGSNAHVLLEAAPTVPASSAPLARPTHVLAMSANSPQALAELATAYATRLTEPGHDLASLCASANTQRHHFSQVRRVAFGRSQAQLIAALTQDNEPARSTHRSSQQRIAFLFTGQGAQYVNMGRELYESHPSFRADLHACDQLLLGKRSIGLLELLFPAEDQASAMNALLANTDYTQPALFCLEYALARLWLSWGVHPEILMGHSLGEFAAAAVAGVFSLQDGLMLVEARGRLMQALPEAGGMLAVFGHESDLVDILAKFPSRLSIAAYNGPGQLVLSGAIGALESAHTLLKQRNIDSKWLHVSQAFHSPLMQAMLEPFRLVAQAVQYSTPAIPIISNITGQLETDRLACADYWVEHVSAPVRFAQSVDRLKQLGINVLVEVGPQPVLIGMAQRMWPAADCQFLSSLKSGQSDWTTLVGTIAALYEGGTDIDWQTFEGPFGQARHHRLPAYPFQGKHYWFEESSRSRPAAGLAARGHPLLGSALSSPRLKEGERIFESAIELPGPAFFRLPIEPAERRVSIMAFLEMALAAQNSLLPSLAHGCIRNITLHGLLQIPRDDARTLQTLCEPAGDSCSQMTVWAQESDHQWRHVASARLCPPARPRTAIDPLARLRKRIRQVGDVEQWYESTRASGLNYCISPHSSIRRFWLAPGEVLADVMLQEQDDTFCDGLKLRHSLWHACNQVLGALCPRDGHGTYFPVEAAVIQLLKEPGRALVIHARLLDHDAASASCLIDITIYDEDGALLVFIEGAKLVPDELQRGPRVQWKKAAEEDRPALLAGYLRQLVARSFKRPIDEIPLDIPLTRLGLDSLTAIEIVARTEQLFEVALDVAMLQHEASLNEVVRMLENRLAEAEGWLQRPSAKDSLLVDLNRGDSTLPTLFLIHPVGGSVFCYQELARHLGSQPIVGIQSPAMAGITAPITNLEQLASLYLTLIRERQPTGPYRLGGWSMGGVLATEVTRQLEALGSQVECLLLIDALVPRGVEHAPTAGHMRRLFATDIGVDVSDLDHDELDGDAKEAIDRIVELANGQHGVELSLSHHDMHRLLSIFDHNLGLLNAYKGHPLHGTATLVRAETPLIEARPEASGHEWDSLLAGIDGLHTVPGDHFGLLSGTHLMLTASYIRKALKKVNMHRAGDNVGQRALAALQRPHEQHIVINTPTTAPGLTASTTLLVNEQHPYFFDHPLDHVSGILMVEGMLQLAETAGLLTDKFVRHLRLTFPRFCEKDRPAVLELRVPMDGDFSVCTVVQANLPVCTMKFLAGRQPSRTWPAKSLTAPPPAPAELLHKHKAENVLISDWEHTAGVMRCQLLAPPSDHQLSANEHGLYSPLYVVETVRQFVTGLVHEHYQVPLGMPMLLIGLELFLDTAVPCGPALTLVHQLKPLPEHGGNAFANFEVDLRMGDEVLGICRLTAQVLDKTTYQQVRFSPFEIRKTDHHA